MNDDQLKQAMRDTADAITPPINDLVEGGVARGERIRRRHTVKVAVGTLAVAVAATGAAFAVPQLADRPDTVASDDEVSMDAEPEGEPITEESVVETVLELLPPGEVTDIQTHSLSEFGASFQLVYDDGHGPSLIQGRSGVSVHGEGLDSDEASAECGAIVNGGECDTRTLDDGTELIIRTGPYYPQPDREPERLHWSVQAWRPDGLTITIGEINAPTEKESEISREEPPLSTDQLSAIVTSDRWPQVDEEILQAAAERERQEQAKRQENEEQERARRMPAGEELATDLGPGWVATNEDGMWGTATPGPDLAEGLPDGYEHAIANRDVFGDNTALEMFCGEGGVEKGLEAEPCEESSLPDGSTVHTKWMHTVADSPYAEDPDASMQDSVMVLHRQDDGSLVTVALWVAEPSGTSTTQRQADAVDWLEERLDDVIQAATVGGLEDDNPSP
ncbi:hypothetical protein [Phytoactinopolyspora endophytica]|uniref:hypothetical protein n=1 Tax=Phytoactinopolyspora endophytica TaxID=1642495 RepID=UPI00101E0FF6|nr:hypothetical protein [Phytoactinopolyspora endophytica]